MHEKTEDERAETLRYIAEAWDQMDGMQRVQLLAGILSILSKNRDEPLTLEDGLLMLNDSKRVD